MTHHSMKNIIAILSATIILTGCGATHTPGLNQPTEASPTQEAPAETPSVPADESWSDGGIGDTVSLAYSDGTESYDITITKAEQVDSIPNAASNPDWQGEDTGQYMTATPEPGKKFYHITYTIKNTGSANTIPMLDTNVLTKDYTEHAQSTLDQEATTNLNTQTSSVPYGLNPGDSGTLHTVISVPANTAITHIILSDPSIDMRGAVIIHTN